MFRARGTAALSPGLYSLQLPHRPQHPLPHGVAVQIALLQIGVGPHGGDRRVLAVLLHEDVGGAVDVEGGDHRSPLFYAGLPQPR